MLVLVAPLPARQVFNAAPLRSTSPFCHTSPLLLAAAGSDSHNARTPDGETGVVAVEMMAVADLSSSQNGAGAELPKVAVPPRTAVPPSTNISSAASSPFQTPQFPRIPGAALLEQYISSAFSLQSPPPPPLPSNTQQLNRVLESRLQQQTLDLRRALADIAEKDAQIQEMKAQAAEREGRLRSARSDLMEARVAAAEKEAKLVEVYKMLADAGTERARMRDELTQTKMELRETQQELESLADEILAMKDYVFEDDDGVVVEEDKEEEEGVVDGAGPGWGVLQNLADMSKQMVEDAQVDEEAFEGAGYFSSASLANRLRPPPIFYSAEELERGGGSE